MGSNNNEMHMYAGVLAGLASTVILNPVDVIKTRYQVYDGKMGSAYSSLWNAVKTIARTEGIRGFCSGLVPASIASTVAWGGYFYFYEKCKSRRLASLQALTPEGEVKPTQLPSFPLLLCGIEAGSIMVLFTNPLWLIKTRLQIQGVTSHTDPTNTLPKYKGFIDALRSIVMKEGGIRTLYRGSIPALFLTTHGAVQFVSYEYLKNEVDRFGYSTRYQASDDTSRVEIPMHITMALGVISKVVAATVTYPYQVIKSRLQQRDMVVEHNLKAKYSGTFDCIKQIIRLEGFRGFYKGYIANCIKVAPSAAITFAVYEHVLKLLMKMKKME